jgi:Flp pilus assembly protein TadG
MFVERTGVVAIIVALTMIPLFLAAGGAIDLARLYMAKERLRHALDAALLAAGSSEQADRLTTFNNFFAKNYPATDLGTTDVTPPPFNVNDSEFKASGTVQVPTVFLKLIKMDTLTASATATVIRRTTGVEVALVLDNSGSMGEGTKLADLKTAALALVDIVSGGQDNPDKAWFSVIPFVATVNIGTENSGLAPELSPLHEYPHIGDTSWKGCVEALDDPDDVLDDTESGWRRFFWQAETFSVNPPVPQLQCANRWWRPADGVDPGVGRPTGYSGSAAFTDVPNTFYLNPGDDTAVPPILPDTPLPNNTPDENGYTTGPNAACPTPLLPLTNAVPDVKTSINSMQFWEKGGTHINLGAVWGWRVLSPAPPFTEGKAYNSPDINKVMIILTDGDHLLIQQPTQCEDTKPDRYTSHYTAYRYLPDGKLGTTNFFQALQALDDRFEAVCQNIKAKGIIIYTIGFGLTPDPEIGDPPDPDADIKEDLRNCSSASRCEVGVGHVVDQAFAQTLEAAAVPVPGSERRRGHRIFPDSHSLFRAAVCDYRDRLCLPACHIA